MTKKRIIIVTPKASHTLIGNHITASRIARLLKKAGHYAEIAEKYNGQYGDLLIALHALHSSASMQLFKQLYPEHPLVLVMTGTDLYRDIKSNSIAQNSMEMATRLVVLQKMAIKVLPISVQDKTRIIYQSTYPVKNCTPISRDKFNVIVIANLRTEKDPLRTAKAARLLPQDSKIQITHIGGTLDKDFLPAVLQEVEENPRYCWLGSLSYRKTRHLLARAHLLSITSLMEGGSNVLSEALASNVPVISSKIDGIVGTLGEKYAGYFPAGDSEALAQQLYKAEQQPTFYKQLMAACNDAAKLVEPDYEYHCWQELLKEVL